MTIHPKQYQKYKATVEAYSGSAREYASMEKLRAQLQDDHGQFTINGLTIYYGHGPRTMASKVATIVLIR